MQSESTFLFYEIIRKVPGLIILGAAIYYLIKKKNAAGWILTIGQAGSFITGLLQSFMQGSMISGSGKLNTSYMAQMQLFSSLGFFFYFIFAVGVLLVVLAAIKKPVAGEYQLLDDSLKQESDP